MISRGYNAILRTTLGAGSPTHSAASRRSGATGPRRCCRTCKDQAWFFDTELLVLAERAGLRIHEVPVDWVDDPHSTVDIASTARADLRGVARLMRGPRLAGQVSRFAAIGVVSTLAYLALYVVLRSGHERASRQRPGAGDHGGRQHRRQSADHVRGHRSRRA